MPRSALIVIDVQCALFDPAPRPFEADAVLSRINQLSAAARAAGVPVVWVQHETADARLLANSPGWALPSTLHTAVGDHRVRKTTPDAFLRTGLADWLAARDIKHLVLCGYATEYCVDTSTRRAAALGHSVTLVADGHTTHDKPHSTAAQIRAHHNATLPALTSFGPAIRALAVADITFEAQATLQPPDPAQHRVHTLAQLATLYGQPGEASLRKETTGLTAPYRALLQASPLVVLATCGPGGLDASPRGDPGCAVTVQDDHTLLLADRRGNQRLDSLRNILADPRVALLCLVPGRSETLRINGRAHISTNPALCARLAVDGNVPTTVLVVQIETVFYQCARALLRAQLWQPETWPAAGTLPSSGQMQSAARPTEKIDPEAYDRSRPPLTRDLLY